MDVNKYALTRSSSADDIFKMKKDEEKKDNIKQLEENQNIGDYTILKPRRFSVEAPNNPKVQSVLLNLIEDEQYEEYEEYEEEESSCESEEEPKKDINQNTPEIPLPKIPLPKIPLSEKLQNKYRHNEENSFDGKDNLLCKIQPTNSKKVDNDNDRIIKRRKKNCDPLPDEITSVSEENSILYDKPKLYVEDLETIVPQYVKNELQKLISNNDEVRVSDTGNKTTETIENLDNSDTTQVIKEQQKANNEGVSALKSSKKSRMNFSMFKIVGLMSLLHIGRAVLVGSNPMLAVGITIFTLNASLWSIHNFVLNLLARTTFGLIQFLD